MTITKSKDFWTSLQSCQGNIVNVFCESAEVHPDALKGFILVGLRGEGEEGWAYPPAPSLPDPPLGFTFFIYCKLSFSHDEMSSDTAPLRPAPKSTAK